MPVVAPLCRLASAGEATPHYEAWSFLLVSTASSYPSSRLESLLPAEQHGHPCCINLSASSCQLAPCLENALRWAWRSANKSPGVRMTSACFKVYYVHTVYSVRTCHTLFFVRTCHPYECFMVFWGAGAGVGGPPLARRVAFMKVVAALAARLRSLFVPYFRYVLPLAMEALGTLEGQEDAAPVEAPLKKRKKSKKAPAAASTDLPDGKDVQLGWLLRFQVLTCAVTFLSARILHAVQMAM